MEKKKAILVDIDGTLAILNDRDPYNPETCEQDELNKIVANVIILFEKAGFKIILATGREEQWRQQTVNWLHKNEIPYNLLLMRPDGNRISATQLKRQWYIDDLQYYYEIILVLEDLYKTIEMFRKYDIPAWQVNPDPFYD